ncbi:MAG: hypothetical protein ACRCX2_39055 [Paraclostridium sp.]
MIIKCTSSNVSKTRMKITFGYNFQSIKMPCKLKHPNILRNFFSYKFAEVSYTRLKCASGQKYKTDTFKCKSLNTNAHVKFREYKIDNAVIEGDILAFRNIANIFLDIYNGKNYGKTITKKSDSAFVVLKFHEKNIKTAEQFMKMKVQDVITDKLFFSLSCL